MNNVTKILMGIGVVAVLAGGVYFFGGSPADTQTDGSNVAGQRSGLSKPN